MRTLLFAWLALSVPAQGGMAVLRSFPNLNVTGVAIDSTGATVVAGSTTQAGYPTTTNAIQRDYRATQCMFLRFPEPCTDGYVARIAPDGTVLYATYFGGSASEAVTSLAVDETGAIYLLGTTGSVDFPFSMPSPSNSNAPFLLKIAGDGALSFALRLPAGLTAILATTDDGTRIDEAHPAQPGSIIRIYGTGFGNNLPQFGVGPSIAPPISTRQDAGFVEYRVMVPLASPAAHERVDFTVTGTFFQATGLRLPVATQVPAGPVVP